MNLFGRTPKSELLKRVELEIKRLESRADEISAKRRKLSGVDYELLTEGNQVSDQIRKLSRTAETVEAIEELIGADDREATK